MAEQERVTLARAAELSLQAVVDYAEGSSRGALVPIDEAVVAAAEDPEARQVLEQRLVEALGRAGSALGRSYVCRKLALIGSARCVSALASQLTDPDTADEACRALEMIGGEAATAALRERLPQLKGAARLAVIHSLGRLGDGRSVSLVSPWLKGVDEELAAAAAATLGVIGTVEAAKSLLEVLSSGDLGLRARMADAGLCCAERLATKGNVEEAKALYRTLSREGFPAHVREAGQRASIEH